MRDGKGTVVSLPPIFSDQPLDDAKDVLSFEFDRLAVTLAQLALNPGNSTPFTVVVRGQWGRGKTTLLRRVEHLLQHPAQATKARGKRNVRPLWFNAWKYPGEDTVLAGLLGALLDEFRTESAWEQLKLLVESHKGSLFGAALKMAAPAKVQKLIEDLKEEDRFSAAERKRAFHDTFRLLFCQLSSLYLDDKCLFKDIQHRSEKELWTREKARAGSLAIFLDDLDRCRPERVREVLEAINLFLDLPGVCFFLGADWDRLKDCLGDVAEDQREQYLEKIVQVKLDLPTVSREDGGQFLRRLADGVKDTSLGLLLKVGREGDETLDLAKILQSCHPRHIKRFLNDLSMIVAVLDNTQKLGSGPKQVSEAAVLAWHVLNEVLPDQTWKEIRLSEGHLRAYLRQALEEESAVEPGAGGKEARTANEALREPHRRETLDLRKRHLQVLNGLSPDQLHVLVHMASPPASAEPKKVRASLTSDLLSLHSGAWVELEAKTPFQMGSEDGGENEKPVHPVNLSPYWMSRHPVTNADYAAYLKGVEVKEPPGHWEEGKIPEGKERHPVVYVSWRDAEAYCAWLTTKLNGRGSKGEARLPTEAQWEFAARGHEGRRYPWDDTPEPDQERANFGKNVDDTTPVGAYPKGATSDGIYDLAGNVWEWCLDWFKDHYEEGLQQDPKGPGSGTSRVVRGGAFYNFPRALRGACRGYLHPEFRSGLLGFRVVFVSG